MAPEAISDSGQSFSGKVAPRVQSGLGLDGGVGEHVMPSHVQPGGATQGPVWVGV